LHSSQNKNICGALCDFLWLLFPRYTNSTQISPTELFLPSAHQKIKTCVSAACVFSTLSVSNVALIGKWHVKVNYWKNIKYTRCCSKIKRLLRVSCEMMKGNFLRAPCNNSNIFISFKPCLELHCMDLG